MDHQPSQLFENTTKFIFCKLTSVSNAKSYYRKAVINNGSKAEALYHTGANNNFLDKKYALKSNINVIPISYPVSMASGEWSCVLCNI